MLSLIEAVATRLAAIAPYLALGLAVEAVAPADPRPARNYGFNLACTALFWTIDAVVGASFALYVSGLAGRLPGAGVLTLVPTRPVSLIGTVALWLLLHDFFYYWMHRAQHTSACLWAQHELHHSDDQMNVTTAWRHHWLELPLIAVAVYFPLHYMLRVPISVIVLASVGGKAVASLVHLNARLSLGRFCIVATPSTHRIHHSRDPIHTDKNFAATFPVWDVLFGTFHQPAHHEWPATGLHSGRTVTRVRDALLWPFLRWSGAAD